MVCPVPEFVMFITFRREQREEQVPDVAGNVTKQFVVIIGADTSEGRGRGCPVPESGRSA
jgi:hypothetical protein